MIKGETGHRSDALQATKEKLKSNFWKFQKLYKAKRERKHSKGKL